jgi:hypothetical protein
MEEETQCEATCRACMGLGTGMGMGMGMGLHKVDVMELHWQYLRG